MAVVAKKSKKGNVKKAVPEKPQSKFFSQALVNRKKNAKGKKRKHPKTRGTVFVKNLPHGFFEEQLRGFFTQFGSITRLRLGRSKKTLKSRGYAFIEFRYPEVAEIATDAINNYIMFKRIIKAKFIPPTQIRHDYFKTSIHKIRNEQGEKEFTSTHRLASKMNVEHQNRLRTDDDQTKRMKKIAQKMNKKKKLFGELGMDYDLDAVAKDMGITLKSKEDMTISTLNDTALDGEGDETFDPEKMDLASDDEIEELDGSEDEDEDVDEEMLKVVKEKAIQIAKNASKQKEPVEKKSVEKIVKPVVKKSSERVTRAATKKTDEKPAKPLAKKQAEKPAPKKTEKAPKPAAKSVEKAPKPAKKSTEVAKPLTKKKPVKEASPKKTVKAKKAKKV